MKLMAFLSTLVFTNSNKYRVSSVNIKQGMPGDGLVFINDDNPVESVIVNSYTFVSLVKGIMIAYGKKSEGEAESIINNSPMLTVPPQNYLEACLLGHEEEYYWAMVISHGDRYFEKGFSYAAPDSYDEWESEYINDNNLKTNALIFKDKE